MGVRNYLIEGSSGSGKTTVCDELLRRGYRAIHGDRILAYQGDPETGVPLSDEDLAAAGPFAGRHRPRCDCANCLAWADRHWIWDVERAASLATELSAPVTYFCGGLRNYSTLAALFDGVFILDVDHETLMHRLAQRPPDEFGGQPAERDFVARLRTRQDRLHDRDVAKDGIVIDTSRPLRLVVDEILGHL